MSENIESNNYDTTKGIVFVIAIDGFYTLEKAREIKKALTNSGFPSHIAEV